MTNKTTQTEHKNYSQNGISYLPLLFSKLFSHPIAKLKPPLYIEFNTKNFKKKKVITKVQFFNLNFMQQKSKIRLKSKFLLLFAMALFAMANVYSEFEFFVAKKNKKKIKFL